MNQCLGFLGNPTEAGGRGPQGHDTSEPGPETQRWVERAPAPLAGPLCAFHTRVHEEPGVRVEDREPGLRGASQACLCLDPASVGGLGGGPRNVHVLQPWPLEIFT